MGYCDDLYRRAGNSINHRVGKSAQKIFPCVVHVLGPARRTIVDDSDGVVEGRHKGNGGGRVALGIPIARRLCFSNCAGVESNAWRGHRTVRGFGVVPPTREPILLFPDLIHRYGGRFLYPPPIRHLHRRHRPSCPIGGQPGLHAPPVANSIPLSRPFVEPASWTQSIRLAEVRQYGQPKKGGLVPILTAAKQIGLAIPRMRWRGRIG